MRWIMLSLLTLAVGLAALPAAATHERKHNRYPLVTGSYGERVCAAQWLLAGHKPSRYGSTVIQTDQGKVRWFRTYRWPVGEGNCGFARRTRIAVVQMKFRLGYPAKGECRAKGDAWKEPSFGQSLRDILLGKRNRPGCWVLLAAKRQPPPPKPATGYPLGNRASSWCGVPGQGTHSWYAAPTNWQSDNAVDMCVGGRALPVVATHTGRICPGFGFGNPGLGGRFYGERLHLCDRLGRVLFFYNHIKIARGVYRGKAVKAGDYLGNVLVGAFSPAHLHFAAPYGFRITAYLTSSIQGVPR